MGIDASKQAFNLIEHGLEELRLLLRAVHYHSSQPIILVDDDRRCLDASFGAGRLLGLSRDEVVARRIDDLVAPGFRSILTARWQLFLDKGEQSDKFPMLLSGGSEREVGYLARARLLPGHHRLVLSAGGPAKSSRKRTQTPPIPSWVRDSGLVVLDAGGCVAAWYSGAQRIYGYANEEIAGKHLSVLYQDEEAGRAGATKDLARAAVAGRVGSQGWHRSSNGSRLWARVLTIALRDAHGQLQGFAVMLRDFSDRQDAADQEWPSSFGVSRVRPKGGPVVGVVSGEFDRVTDATDGFLQILGYSREELIDGKPYWPDLTPPEYGLRDEIAHEEALVCLASTPLEKEFIRKDGSRVSVLATTTVLATHPFRWTTFVQEITDREGATSEEEPAVLQTFSEIIGDSAPLQRVFEQIEAVAPTDATVLILGETGTGKELAARAIHRLSDRCDKPFISLNCAALPAGLLESELFGYEKGAFTGALARKMGRFEMANGGTLFLDEVGDIPLELQPKLLRALQEKEFERLGGTRTIPIDVRLLAATNRNLAQMMGDQLFRSDLYYRLRVFPIVMPPLRDHPTDIPLLARHFVQKYCDEMKREQKTIPADTMRAMVSWTWPGNIRELENFIERSVILSRGTTLSAPLADIKTEAAVHIASDTLEEVEREHIVHILKESNGVVSTAATRLGMPRTTLNATMRKLGITRKNF